MDTVDPDTGSGERQGLKSSFTGSVQCITGLQYVNKELSKHSIWLLPGFLGQKNSCHLLIFARNNFIFHIPRVHTCIY